MVLAVGHGHCLLLQTRTMGATVTREGKNTPRETSQRSEDVRNCTQIIGKKQKDMWTKKQASETFAGAKTPHDPKEEEATTLKRKHLKRLTGQA